MAETQTGSAVATTGLLRESRGFSGFSVSDIAKAREFYANTLGLNVTEEMGLLRLNLAGGGGHIIYPKETHQPASYTALNFPVANIEEAVDRLSQAGVTFERYEGLGQDARGIAREGGPPIAWFKDPAGNILAVIQL